MSSVILQGGASGTGSMTVLAPNTNSNQIVTIPAATGTVMVSGNMPAFSAHANATQLVNVNTNYKLAINTIDYDTASCFDSTTNYRFTPNVAGYYQIMFNVQALTTNGTLSILPILYKNGAFLNNGIGSSGVPTTYNYPWAGIAFLVYLNGSTDYVEAYAQLTGASGNGTILGGTFQGYLARSA